MKKLSIIIALFIVIISCKGNENKPNDSLVVKTEQNSLKRYQIASGIITYQTTISGKVITSTITGSGTEKRYFKNWGALELYEQNSTTTTVTKVMGKSSTETTTEHQMSKLDNGKSYAVDFKNKSIIETNDMAMEMIKKLHQNADAGEIGKSILEGMGGKQIGSASFLGYTCEIWDLMGVKQWIYKGVMLKSEANLMGITTITEATKATFNIDVPDSNFQLPNYPITKQNTLLSNENFEYDLEDLEQLNNNINHISKLSFEEWKKMVLADKDDEEMQQMSEEELRETYNTIQKMIQLKNRN
jgi:hypothetical protein